MEDNIKMKGQWARDIEAALIRAGKRAEEIARRTGTPLVFWENGQVVEYYPGGEEAETDGPPERPA